MQKIRKAVGIAIVAIFALTIACNPNVIAQESRSKVISFETLLRMFADQPDHLADRVITINGTSFKIRSAKKQGKIRHEFCPLDDPAIKLKNQADRNYKIIIITQSGQPAMAVDPQQNTCAELPGNLQLVPFDIESFIRGAESGMRKEEMRIESLGVVNIEGHQATRIRWGSADESEGMIFYFAKDLNSLFIRMEGSGKYWEGSEARVLKGSYYLSNISLEVSDDLFKVPVDCKKVDFQSLRSTMEEKILR